LSIAETVTGSASAVANVAAPILAISPSLGNPQSTQTLTLTGTNTVWTQEAASGLFALSGGTSVSLGTPTITADRAGSVTLIVGSGTGTLTITDNFHRAIGDLRSGHQSWWNVRGRVGSIICFLVVH
jgi:hypothetical protein